MDIINANFGVSGKGKDEVTNKVKTEAWESVAKAVNAAGGPYRSVDRVRKKWTDLKSRAFAKFSANHNGTGGGKGVKYTKWEQMIIDMKADRNSNMLTGMDGYNTGSRAVSLSIFFAYNAVMLS